MLIVLPFIQSYGHPNPSSSSSSNRLEQIANAIQNYHEAYGHLPPAAVCDKEGHPLYSWRVLILPFIEHADIHEKFKLDEPWDSPHNLRLNKIMPRCYRSPFGAGEDDLTMYQALVGPGTAFERPGLTWADFPDGRENTILVVEAGESVPWAKPVDLKYDPYGPLPQFFTKHYKPLQFLGCAVGGRQGFAARFADGSLHVIRNSAEEARIRALITRNGGERVDFSRLE